MSARYPDPVLDALLEERASIEHLLRHNDSLFARLLIGSPEDRRRYEQRLQAVKQQIAVLQGDPV